jgi:hypothetical protein
MPRSSLKSIKMRGNKMKKLIKLLELAEKRHLFGSIELQFRDGRLVLIRRSETIIPDSENESRNKGSQEWVEEPIAVNYP